MPGRKKQKIERKEIQPINVALANPQQIVPLPLFKDLIIQILDSLTVDDILNLRLVNKSFNRFITAEYIEKLNKILWFETFAEFKQTNLEGFIFPKSKSSESTQKQSTSKKKRRKSKKSNIFTTMSETLREFDGSLGITCNSSSPIDFFFKKLRSFFEYLRWKYGHETAVYYLHLTLLVAAGATVEFKEYFFENRKNHGRAEVDAILLNYAIAANNSTLIEIIYAEILEKEMGITHIIPMNVCYIPNYLLTSSLLISSLESDTATLKKLIFEKAKTDTNIQLEVFHSILTIYQDLKSSIFSYLLRNKNTLSSGDLQIFDFIKTGNTKFFEEYVKNFPTKKNIKIFDLRMELLRQLAQKILTKSNYDLAEWYLTAVPIGNSEFKDRDEDREKWYATIVPTTNSKLDEQFKRNYLNKFIMLALNTKNEEIFKKFANSGTVMWQVLKELSQVKNENSLANFDHAIFSQCLEYVEHCVQHYFDFINEEQVYQGSVLAQEKNRLDEFTTLIAQHCPRWSYVPFIIAVQTKTLSIIANVTNQTILNTYLYNKTALHYAAETGDQHLVTTLLNNGANLHARATIRSFLCPTWYVALLKNHLTLAQQLLERSVKDNPYLAIFKAIIADDLTAVEKAITSQPFFQFDNCTIDGISLFDLASLLKRQEIISYFLKNYNIAANQQNTIIAVKTNNLELLKQLIANGGDINVKINAETSLLTYALENDYLDIAEYLLTKGIPTCDRDFSFPTLANRKSLLIKLFNADLLANPGDNTTLLFNTYHEDLDLYCELLARNNEKCPSIDTKNEMWDVFGQIGARSFHYGLKIRGSGLSKGKLDKYKNCTTPKGLSLFAYAIRCSHGSAIDHYRSQESKPDVIGKTMNTSPIFLAAKLDNWYLTLELLPLFLSQQATTNLDIFVEIAQELYQLAKKALENPRYKQIVYKTLYDQVVEVKEKIEKVLKDIKKAGSKAILSAMKEKQWHKAQGFLEEFLHKVPAAQASKEQILDDLLTKEKVLDNLWQLVFDEAEKNNMDKELETFLNFIEKCQNQLIALLQHVRKSYEFDSESESESDSDPDSANNSDISSASASDSEKSLSFSKNPQRFKLNPLKHSSDTQLENQPPVKKINLTSEQEKQETIPGPR